MNIPDLWDSRRYRALNTTDRFGIRRLPRSMPDLYREVGSKPLTAHPQRRNCVGATDQQALGVLVKGIRALALHIDRADHLISFAR
jgi:hypothetical protein